MKKFLTGLIFLMFLSVMTTLSYSFTFSDDFDDNGLYDNWTSFSGTWGYVQLPPTDDFVLKGLNDTGIPNNVAGIQYNGRQFPTQNINMTTRFKIQEGGPGEIGGGIGFAVNGSGIHIHDYTGFWVGVNKWNDQQTYVLAMGHIELDGPPLHQIPLLSLPPILPPDMVLKLSIQTGYDDKISVILEEWIDSDMAIPIYSGTFDIGLTDGPLSGGTGLYTNQSAEFKYFSVTDNVPVPAIISGTVDYSGSHNDEIFIAAANAADFSIASKTSIPGQGTYSFSVPPGNYYIVAQMDTDQSGGVSFHSFQQSEPSGSYNAGCGDGGVEDLIAVDGALVRDIDIYLTDFKQSNIRHDIFTADYFSGHGNDMGFHDSYLWICDYTWPGTGPIDIRKVDPKNGNLAGSFDLNINSVTSLEWIDNDIWVCFKNYTRNAWVIKKFAFDGISFTPGVDYPLPSSMDEKIVWSINIAFDGSLLWVQEKGHGAAVYKVDLSDGSIVETILCDEFEYNKKVGLADISDISFSDGFLWAMDDGYPIFVQIDPISSQSINYTFDRDTYSFDDDAKFAGMVKNGKLFYFLQKTEIKDSSGNVIDETYQIQSASIDQCIFKTITLNAFAAGFGQDACNWSGVCEGDGDFDFDIDGMDLQDILSCQE